MSKQTMKRGAWILLMWLYVAGGSVWANDDTVWHQGQLVLQNGSELNGAIAYSWLAQVVRYQQGTITKAYSAGQIQSFTYYDDQLNTIRRFITVDYPIKAATNRPRILENVISGSLQVFRDYHPNFEIVKSNRLADYDFDAQSAIDLDTFTYLVFFNEELIEMNEFYRKIWPRLKTVFESEYKKHSGFERAEVMGTASRLRLIFWYNSLADKMMPPSQPEPSQVLVGH